MAGMDAARRTLGCWILSAFLQRGCDPTAARTPRVVWSVRPLSAREMAELSPVAWLAPLGLVLAPLTNLRWLPAALTALGAPANPGTLGAADTSPPAAVASLRA
jgi:hypothetical protein